MKNLSGLSVSSKYSDQAPIKQESDIVPVCQFTLYIHHVILIK